MKSEKYAGWIDVLSLMEDAGWPLDSNAIKRIDAHLMLIMEHGSTFGVVSESDIRAGAYQHVVDSLSLIPYLVPCLCDDRMPFIDVGSGGGFPGVVVGSLFPEHDVVLLERSEKKCAFLRRVIGELGLGQVTIANSRYQDILWGSGAVAVGVRGLERASIEVPVLTSGLSAGSVCFWLAGPKAEVGSDSRFHVEQIVDKWTMLGLRRGALFKLSVS